jgi:hypothetical protein
LRDDENDEGNGGREGSDGKSRFARITYMVSVCTKLEMRARSFYLSMSSLRLFQVCEATTLPTAAM